MDQDFKRTPKSRAPIPENNNQVFICLARRWLTGLIPELQSEGFTTLAVMDLEIHPQEEVRAISGLFEGEVSIYGKETQKGVGKFLKIKKMSNQKYLEGELPLKK